MPSDKEVLITVLQAEGKWFDEANKTTPSAKSRDRILRSPGLTPSATWLHLGIVSINIMNTAGDKGQPWLRVTFTGNGSDI